MYDYSKEMGGQSVNRVRLGAAILLALLVLSIGTAWYVRSETNRLLSELDHLELLTQTGTSEQTQAAFQSFQMQWERSEKILNLMVWRDKVLQIDIAVSHLTPMLLADCDELGSELAETRMWIERLERSELPIFWNIV